MRTVTQPNNDNIVQLPISKLVVEGQSQCNRIIEEVMNALYSKLPQTIKDTEYFLLSNGTKCWIKKFSAPRKDDNGNWEYGFDIKFDEKSELSHIEFSVKCSGWERALLTPTTE